MEGDSQANNQQTANSDTALMSAMTSITHSVPSHIVDDFEPDPKCEITTLEKASYDCNEMEKVIDNIVDLGGCQQIVSDMDQQECTTNREQEVENIQREIIGDRIHTHVEQKQEQQNQTEQSHNEREQEDQTAQQLQPVEIPLQRQESRTNENTATTFAQETQVDQRVPKEETPETSPTKQKQPTDLKIQDSVPTTEKGLANEDKVKEQRPEREPSPAVEVPSPTATTDHAEDSAALNRPTPVGESKDETADQEQVKSVVEEVVTAEDIVEESVEEEVIEANAESLEDNAGDPSVEGSIENHEQVENSTDQAASKILEPATEVNTVADTVSEKIEQTETTVETKSPAKKRGRKPKSETVIVPVPEVPLVERPRRTRGSLKPAANEEENQTAKESSQAKEKLESVEMEVDQAEPITRATPEVEKPKQVAEEKSDETPTKRVKPPRAEKTTAPVEATPERDQPNSKQSEPEPKLEEVEPEKPVRPVRARAKRSFPEEPPQEPQEKKTVKKARIDKSDTPVSRGISNPKLKLPTRTRVTISTSRPATKPERRCDYDDFGFRKYRCDLCRFSTDRLNTIVEHQKNAVCEAAKRRYESHVQESLHKLQSPKSNKKRYSR